VNELMLIVNPLCICKDFRHIVTNHVKSRTLGGRVCILWVIQLLLINKSLLGDLIVPLDLSSAFSLFS